MFLERRGENWLPGLPRERLGCEDRAGEVEARSSHPCKPSPRWPGSHRSFRAAEGVEPAPRHTARAHPSSRSCWGHGARGILVELEIARMLREAPSSTTKKYAGAGEPSALDGTSTGTDA